MPTNNPRVNVTLSKELAENIALLAEKQGRTMSMMARQLIEEALEMQEDLYFSKLADDRVGQTKKWYTHEEAWDEKG